MKRFKLIFHITYVIIALVVMYFSIDILLNTEVYLSRIKLSSYITFPKKIMGVFLFLSVVMLTEFVLERIIIHRAKKGMSAMEEEVLQLKAKLYDRSQEQPAEQLPEISDEQELPVVDEETPVEELEDPEEKPEE